MLAKREISLYDDGSTGYDMKLEYVKWEGYSCSDAKTEIAHLGCEREHKLFGGR